MPWYGELFAWALLIYIIVSHYGRDEWKDDQEASWFDEI